MLEFEEMRLRVRRIGTCRYLLLANGPAHAATILSIDGEPAALGAELAELIDIELGQAPRRGTDVATRLRNLGRSVFDLLFDQPLIDCLQAVRAQRRRRPHGLRLRFDLPPELRDLPVETLRSPADQAEQTFALNATMSLTRSLSGDPPGHRLPAGSDEPDIIRLLVAVASPAGLPPIDSAAELAALRDSLPELAIQTTVYKHATRRKIESWLAEHAEQPAAVLLIAHGSYDETRGEGVVLLEADDGTVDRVPGHLFSGMLVRAQHLRLVVLNLCSGASATRLEPFSGLAQALVGRGIPAVAGMRGLVTDQAGTMFGPVLLDGICSNKTVDEAMTTARQRLAHLPEYTVIEWATPILFLHESCGHSWLFKAREVRDDDEEATDPLRDGERALAKYRAPGNVKVANVLAAARHLRTKLDWKGVLRTVRTKKPNAEQTLLITEARIELALPSVERLCAVLATEQDFDEAAELLKGMRDQLPTSLFQRLHEEVDQAAKLGTRMDEARRAEAELDWKSALRRYDEVLRQRPDGFRDVATRADAAREEVALAELYASAETHRQAGRWSDALAGYREILTVRSGSYRRAGDWSAYVEGRAAESRGQWADAVASYERCAAFEDAQARLAYVRGRGAADGGDWAGAHEQFSTAQKFGGTPDDWSGYAAATVAAAAGQWDTARTGFACLGSFRDSEEQALFAAGRLAAEAGDWAGAVEAYGRLPEDHWEVDGLLAEAHDGIYRQAVAAEEARDWQDAATHYGMLSDSNRDVADRSRYVAGRLAEELTDWPAAAECYRATGYADARARLGYATARVAEQAGQWSQAHDGYSDLPKQLLDAGARARYAAGRAADEAANWPGVLAGFGDLPDGYADGEVGRRRRFARAKLASRRGDWKSVLALLGDAPDEERDGLVGLARRQARGRLAEEDGHWEAAAEIYAPATAADPDLGRDHRYALGRAAERDGDWERALAAYADCPDDHRDLEWRIPYARARRDQRDQGDWQCAADAYSALPADFEDTAVRLSYARLRLALDQQRWDVALGMVEKLNDHRDAAVLICYARGRAAERCENWAEAIAAYRECAGAADATGRLGYVTGRQLEAAGRWSAAISAYEGSVPDVPGTQERRDRLVRLREELPWADGLASATLVADPLALSDETFPYIALRAAGVTPSSPTEIVKDAAYALMERGGMSWQERVAWDQLRTPAKRLLLDAQLYRFRDPASLARELAALRPDGRSPLLDELCGRLPDDAALLTLLAGDRADAIAAWRRQLADSPGEMAWVQSLAVASFWQARELENTGAWEEAERVWQSALAYWAVLLTDDQYWIGWRQARAACYGHAVTPADTAWLRAELGQYLIKLLTGHGERHADAGRLDQAERYQELVAFLEAELQAAQCLKETGGLPLPGEPATKLACGPAYLRLVGLAHRFGEFVAMADSERSGDTESDAAILRRLRWSFSSLSAAFSRFEQHRFEAALRALPEIYRQRLTDLPADCPAPGTHGAPGDHGTADDCPHCYNFLTRDLAYAFLPERRARLLHDAVGLAIRAHLSIARGYLTSGDQVDAAMAALSDAIAVSANAALTVRTKQAVLRMVLGRVDALIDIGVVRIERLDEAMDLVEKALPVVGAPGRETLTLKRVDLLVDRGVWCGSGCREVGIKPDMARAVADLRAAVELNPESARARYNLARALIFRWDELPGSHTMAGKLASLREALAIVHDGLTRAAASSQLLEALGTVLDALESLLFAKLEVAELARLIQTSGSDDRLPDASHERARALVERGERRRADGDVNAGIHDLVKAVRTAPGSGPVRVALLDAVEAELTRLGRERRDGR